MLAGLQLLQILPKNAMPVGHLASYFKNNAYFTMECLS